MRTAIIGAGFAGATHVEALRACGVEPALIITKHEDTARAFAVEHGILQWGTDLSLACAEEIDAVHICTPPTSHGKLTEYFLQAGKNVLCEKPLCLDPKEAEKLCKLAKESGKICALTLNVRYHMACQRAREIIGSGALGRPVLIHGNYLQEFGALPAALDWRFVPELGGSMRAVTEIGSHWVDIAQYISGDRISAVSAQFATFHPIRKVVDGVMAAEEESGQAKEGSAEQTADKTVGQTEKIKDAAGAVVQVTSEDAAAVNLRFASGAIGSVMLSEISQGRGNRLSLEITCENGNLWWNEEENNLLHTARKGQGVNTEVFAFGNGFGDTFTALLKNFYLAVRTGKPSDDCPTFEEGVNICKVCDAMERSAGQDSKWICVE